MPALGLVVLLLTWVSTGSISVPRRKLPGIWKLKSDSLPYEQDIRSKLKGIIDGKPSDILIKINPDGSFRQCNEGYHEGRWLVGQWTINHDQEILLALRRQYYGPQFDVLLRGKVNHGTTSPMVKGNVLKGKFMYQQTHPSFFDTPMVNPECLGSFTLEQSLSTSSIAPVTIQDPKKKDNQFERADFYDLEFIMTIEPTEMASSSKNLDVLNLPFDVRVMPIRFFANNTFVALGTNKILRGRFDITGNDRLTFEVSRFGMGRSVAGSVYSEGRGLTHDDERNYSGVVQEQNGRLRVEGTVTFGTDLGEDARPEPVGRFILTEATSGNGNRFFDLADDNYRTFE
jgi:hypothetical protein